MRVVIRKAFPRFNELIKLGGRSLTLLVNDFPDVVVRIERADGGVATAGRMTSSSWSGQFGARNRQRGCQRLLPGLQPPLGSARLQTDCGHAPRRCPARRTASAARNSGE